MDCILNLSARVDVDAKAQQLPQLPWFITGVSAPFQTCLPSKLSGILMVLEDETLNLGILSQAVVDIFLRTVFVGLFDISSRNVELNLFIYWVQEKP